MIHHHDDTRDQLLARSIIGSSPAIVALRECVRRVGPTPLAVFVHGPSGSGKELVAQAIHLMSLRMGMFVSCNITSFSEGLFEDAMFGHVKGAYTGASCDRSGLFLEADKGTIFLDEIAQLRHSGQVALLRALETKRIRSVGGQRERTVDFRVISATNEDISEMIANRIFREDLWHRLSGTVIVVPSLMERREDIPALVEHFLSNLVLPGEPKSFSAAALERMQGYAWPGNVRELKNIVESLAYLSVTSTIQDRDVELALHRTGPLRVVHQRSEGRRIELLTMLERYQNDVSAVAKHYGKGRATIYRWLHECGISTPNRIHVSTRTSPENTRMTSY